MTVFLRKYFCLWLQSIRRQINIVALVKYRSCVYLLSDWWKKLEDLEGKLLLKGHLAVKRRGPQCSGYRIKIYFHKKEKYIGTHKQLTHHHSIPEKLKTKARRILKLSLKCSTSALMMSFSLLQNWLLQWQEQIFFSFYEDLKG